MGSRLPAGNEPRGAASLARGSSSSGRAAAGSLRKRIPPRSRQPRRRRGGGAGGKAAALTKGPPGGSRPGEPGLTGGLGRGLRGASVYHSDTGRKRWVRAARYPGLGSFDTQRLGCPFLPDFGSAFPTPHGPYDLLSQDGPGSPFSSRQN